MLPSPSPSVRRLLSLLALALVLAGCGEDKLGPLVPVSGKVTLDGKPLTLALVTFIPDSSKGNKVEANVFAVVDANGEYKLVTTTRDRASPRQGASAGWYRVKITPAMPTQPTSLATSTGKLAAPAFKLSPVPAKYQDPSTSSLVVEVSESAPPGAYDFKLVSKK
jgi:hypothetical protein